MRTNYDGHLTDSACIINFSESKVLLHHHQSIDKNIFDLDVHKIPGVKNKAEYYHYDIRCLFKADSRK